MKLQHILVIACLLSITAVPVIVSAESLAMPEEVTEADVRSDLPQPYVVKSGDTLWDIANYFFKDPEKWLRIWEKNLYITNPDLIYPGNEIWFDVQEKKAGGLVRKKTLAQLRPAPRILAKPVERLEKKIDTSRIVTVLNRQDFIQAGEVDGTGYVLDSEDDRIHFGAGDRLYLKMQVDARKGELFDVFRTGDPIMSAESDEPIGFLVEHLGQVEIRSHEQGVYRGVVVNTFKEISRGDKLKPAKRVNTKIDPIYPEGDLNGKVLYIQNNAAEAGQNQVVGISLGLGDGMKAGATLSVHRSGRVVTDKYSELEIQLPEEKIGELLVLVPQEKGSMALVTESTASINIGDAVRNQASR